MTTLSKIRGIHKLKTVTTSGTEPLERLTVDIDDAYHGMDEPGEKKAQEVNRPIGAGMGTLPPAQMTRKIGATTSVVTVLKPPPLLDETRVALLACICAKPQVFADCLKQTVELMRGSGGSAKMTVHFSLVELLDKHSTPPTLGAIFQSAMDQTQYSINPEEAAEELAALKEEMEDVDVERELPFIRDWMESWLKREKVRAATAFAVTAWTAYEEKPDAETYENLRQRMATAHEAVLWMNEPLNSLEGVDASQWLTEPEPEPEPVLDGLLDRGEFMLFGSASKSKKSWCAIQAAVCIVSGQPFWNFTARKGKVVYINFELSPHVMQNRLTKVCTDLKVKLEKDCLFVHNLKGTHAGAAKILAALLTRYRRCGISLFIIDPYYVMGEGKVENATEEVYSVLAQFGRLATQTGAAVWVTHHFSKGNQSAKEAIDRFSGSGVLGRYADTLVTMTAHKESGAFVVEPVLRSHPEVDDFVVRWNFPLMEVDEVLDPADLKKPKNAGGSSPTYPDADFLTPLLQADNMEMDYQSYKTAVLQKTGMSERTFRGRLSLLVQSGKLARNSDGIRVLESAK